MAGTAVALSTGDVFLIAVVVAIPFAVLSFALGAKRALSQVGKGQFAIEQELPQTSAGSAPVSRQAREEEVRQMVEAKAYRQAARGEAPLDVEAEVERLLESGAAPAAAGPAPGGDPELRDEVRQLVVARNERRQRRGESPLDVEAEVERQLRELEGLGQ